MNRKRGKGGSIGMRLIISYAVIALVSIMLVAVLTYSKTSSTMTDKVAAMTASVNDQVRLSINRHLANVEDICTMIFSQKELYTFYNTDESIEEYEKVKIKDDIKNLLLNNSLMENFGDFAIVYDDNTSLGKLASTTSNLFGADKIYDVLKGQITRDTTLDGWFTGYDGYFTRIYYVKQVNDHAVLLAAIYAADLESLVKISSDMSDMTIRLVTSDNYVIYSTAYGEMGKAIDSGLAGNIADRVHSTMIRDEQLITLNTCGDDWKLVSVIPTSSILKEVYEIRNYTVLLAVVCVVIAVAIGVLFSKSITNPMKKIMGMMEKAEKGDLTVRGDFSTFGELTVLKTEFESMLNQISALIREVGTVADTVESEVGSINEIAVQSHTISENIAVAMEDIAKGAQSQLGESQEAFDSLGELAGSIGDTVSNVKDATRESEHSRNIGVSSIGQIGVLSEKTIESQASLKEMEDTFRVLVGEVEDIESVLSVISTLSEETSLLSLNASIEAARAGEHGKGFAVVADSVSKLAQQTAASTESIENVIAKIRDHVQKTMLLIDESKKTFDEQAGVVEKTIDSFHKIVDSADSISSKIGRIDQLTVHMDSLKESTLAATQSILQITENASANTEEVLSVTAEELHTSEILSEKSAELKQAVENLKVSLGKFKVEGGNPL